MPKIHLAAGVLNQTPLDWEGNYQRIKAAIQVAQGAGANLLCLPEMCLTGYGCEDQFFSPFTQQKAQEYLEKLLVYSADIVLLVGLPYRFESNLYNVIGVLYKGKVQAYIPKQYLANEGLHYEARWFTAWPAGKRTSVDGIPFGDYRLGIGEISFGIEICQDAWEGDNRPAHALAKRGVSFICNPTASHFSFAKSKVRKKLALEGAKIIQGGYVFANLLGNESGRTIFDGDAYLVQNGQTLAQTSRFSFQDSQVIAHTFDVREFTNPADDLIHMGPFICPKSQNISSEVPSWEADKYSKDEEFARSIALGLWDYLRKSHSNGFVISLSGGADSSAIASLCATAVHLAALELGWSGIQSRLAYIPWISSCLNEKEFIGKLITTLYQGTVNSSEETRKSAAELAGCIGSAHHEIEIDSLVQGYQALIEKTIQRPLTWAEDDITLQNVQARVRAPSAWMLANIKNALLLATSNRSEASVGYATMDGDTSGSISPIAGIDKTYLRSWLKWMEKIGLDGSWRISGLSYVNRLEPSAELRPLDTKQVDEEDLMPYSILNSLERWSFYEHQSPAACFESLKNGYGSLFSEKQLNGFIHRFFSLWARNQWKRERYAPGFHVDDYSLDPKSWLRFPILSAGLEKDLPQ
ncbi:NAD(+) synthase [Aquirufa sp.]|jgi:NAD+ synthase (glutamine-hydrolysing)|uniref:NAD(+) synthase n=1 Tax=Aquirufa sp. TaxID=2676249 RepID=UPI0037BF5E18